MASGGSVFYHWPCSHPNAAGAANRWLAHIKAVAEATMQIWDFMQKKHCATSQWHIVRAEG